VIFRDPRRRNMRRGLKCRIFVYFICISFLSLMAGSPRWVADAKERGLPIGEMVSRGGVKIEAKENVWKDVEPSHFPIFPGAKIKTTDGGVAAIVLMNHCQIEAGQNSVLLFDQNDRIHLLQGNIDFRIPSGEEMTLRVGNLTVIKSRPFQASKKPASASADQEAIGSVSIHSNGSVTVKNIRGGLSVLNQDRVVLAAVSPKESVTIPSTSVIGTPRVMVAQVGETAPVVGTSAFLGVSTGTWLVVGFAAAALGVGVGVAVGQSQSGGSDAVTCP
jgi:hypothetical protein